MEFIKELSGHSGCCLKLYKVDELFFVRKDAGNVKYNKRLKKQFIKQKRFDLKGAKTPAVLSCGYTQDGIFYFDMEYVSAKSLAELMYVIQTNEISTLIDTLFDSLEITNGKITPGAGRIFKNKIDELDQKLANSLPEAKHALEKVKNFDFSNVPLSHCCGDLTLENILLLPSGQIYLIDLLDSFYNSWMIDVAKLLQDLDLGWSYRHSNRDYNLNLRLEKAKQAILDRILALTNGKDYLLNIYYILLLNVLRIYPYAKDQETFHFLDDATQKVMKKISEMENKENNI